MNRPLLFPSAKCSSNNIKGIFLLFLFLGFATVTSAQTVTLADATGEAASITGGQNNVAVFAFNLTRGTAVNLTGVTVSFSAPIAGIFTNVRLFESTDATFSFGGDTNVGTMTLASGNDYSATFAGRAIAGGSGTYYFIVVNVDPAILSTATISATCAATQITTTDAEAGSATGPTYNSGNINELRADFTQNADAATALGDQNGVELLDFTVLSNGTQNITPSLVFTFDIDVTNVLENWDLQLGGSDIPGTEIYALTGGGTILTVTGFTNVDVSTSKNFQLFADIKEGALSTNDFTVSLASSGVAVDVGYPEAFTTFTNSIDVTALTADFTQNADAATAIADENGVELLDFTVLSNGAQSITPDLVFTFNVDVTNILENWDLRVGGSDIPGSENYVLSGGGTILTVSGFTNVDVSTTKNFQLFADIKAGATSSSDFIITLQTSGVDVNVGYAETFTFTNNVDVTALTADFTQNADASITYADENGVELLDFTVLSNGSQNIVSPLVFTFNVDVTNILENWDLRVGGSDIPGSENYALSGGGTILTVTGFTNVDISTSKNFQLYADIKVGALTTNDFTISLAPSGVTVSGGLVEAFGTYSNAVDITVSALSNIVFTGSSGVALNYRNRQAATIDDADLNGSFRLATFSLQDGGGASDADFKVSSISSITLQITNPANIKRIALFNDVNSQLNDEKEIAGTEKDMPVSGIVTFTPSTPIRTLTDGGNWNFMVRVTFNQTVGDNDVLTVTVNSVTGEAEYSGFATANAGGANSSTGSNKTILVTASKFKFNPAVATTSPKTLNFGPVTIVAVDGNPPLSNIDKDYNGKIDLIATGGPGALTGGGQKTFSAGTLNISTLSINQAGTYSLEVSDDEYNDAPDNQPSIEDISASIIITSSAADITESLDPDLCYGAANASKTLSNIVIKETDAAGITGSGSVTFSLALPSGFVFDQSITTGVSVSGSDLSSPSGYTYPGANVVQFSFDVNGTANINEITISNLKARYPHPGTNNATLNPTGLLNITRLGGTAEVAGVGAGTILGKISARKQMADVSFTVTALPGNPAVDPSTTKFNANSVPVKLLPSSPTTESAFQGSGGGVTLVGSDYRFSPSSLAAGTYPVTLIHTNPTPGSTLGCQSYSTRNFEVVISGIAGLNTAYCNNAGPSSDLTVNQAYIDQIMQFSTYPTTWVIDKFVYCDYNTGWKNMVSPVNNKFAPAATEYQSNYASWGGRIPIGFSVYNTNPLAGVPQGSNYVATYQWVTVNAAPSPTLTLPKNNFCLDDPSVVITGTPPNSDNTGKDFFFATDTIPPLDPMPSGTISVTAPATSKVWSFNPGAMGVGVAYIRYTYENPATGCTGTSPTITVRVNARPASVLTAAITSPGGIAPETCQGAPIGTFTATPLTAPSKYTWYSNAALTNEVGSGNSFTPPKPPVDPNIPTPPGSPHTFYVTQTVKGCESNKQLVAPPPPLSVTVTIKPAPAAPVPNFADVPSREFCVGETILLSRLEVPGSNVKFYSPGTSTVLFTGSNPQLNDLSLPNPTTGPALYTYEVSQTVSLCESPRATLRVRIKGLPSLSVVPSTDLQKICTEGGHDGGSLTLITFAGSDENGPIISGTSSWATAPSTPTLTLGALIDGGATALLNTPTLVPNDYTLRFTHTNTAGCSNFIDMSLKVLPKIIPSLNPLDSCFKSFVRLNNTSKIQTGPGAPTPAGATDVISMTWNFNDGDGLPEGNGNVPSSFTKTKGTYFNPEHDFAVLGSKQVTYEMKTTYCSFKGTEQITINPKPQINFIWKNPCLVTKTELSETRFTATEATSIPIMNYNWDFSVKDNLDHTATGGATPTVRYEETGIDSVRLIAETFAHCLDTLKKVIQILPTYKAITDTTGYDQNFNAGSNFWIEGGVLSSWQLGSTLAGTTPSDGAAWATNLNGPNKNGERSWVMSGCFNFKDAKKPVVSLDIWSDTPFGVDGAVFQYNEDGLIEDDDSWKSLGEVGTGINWYDGSGISNSPGNQSANDYGWTGIYSGWKKAIYKLDDVKPVNPSDPDSLIVFRVAFAGGNRQQSGFAFDNIFIGERSRVVLLENFTNSSSTASSHSLSNYENFASAGNSNEIIKIQYHTAFPGDDPMNDLNNQMNNARAAFYGITIAPTVRIDGDFSNGTIGSWLSDTYDDRVLTPSSLKLNVTAVKDGDVVKINTSVENTTSQNIHALQEKLHIFTVVIDTLIDESSLLGNSGKPRFINVAREMFPSPAGFPIPGDILPGTANAFVAEEVTWRNPHGTKVVVFVQKIDGNHKDVYQAVIVKPLGGSPSDLVTGTEDPEYAKHVQVYPNPANNVLNIELPVAASKPTPVVLFDTFGRIVYQAEFKAGERIKTLSTTNFAEGMYMVQLPAPQGTNVIRKVMVKH